MRLPRWPRFQTGSWMLSSLKKTDIFQILPLLIAVLNGDHVNHQAVEYLQAREITIENLSGREIALDYDGEYFEDGFPAQVIPDPMGV